MKRKPFPPDQAVRKAIALLQNGKSAPEEAVLRGWVERDVNKAMNTFEKIRLGLDHKSTLERIQDYASALLKALDDLRNLSPWVTSRRAVPHESNPHGAKAIGIARGPLPMFDLLPVMDMQQLENELKSLVSLGNPDRGEYGVVLEGWQYWDVKQGPWAGNSVELTLPKKRVGRQRLQQHILDIHFAARFLLESCEIKPSSGTGGAVAKLGALLCDASSVELSSDESTQAARLAVSSKEWLAYKMGHDQTSPVVDESGRPVLNLNPDYPQCEVLRKWP